MQYFSIFLILLVLGVWNVVVALDNDYQQQRLLTCQIRNNGDINILHGLRAKGLLDLWTENLDNLPVNVTFRCQVNVTQSISMLLQCQEQRLLLPILELAAKANSIQTKSFEVARGGEFFDNYQSYEEILKWLQDLDARHNPKVVVRLENVGNSVEGRTLPVVHITKPQGNLFSKKILWISGGQHAREWIAPASVLFLIDTLVEQRDPVLDSLLSTHIIILAPLINPDGYEYSRTTDRLWRKNRSRNLDGSFGTDLNRNWAAEWGIIGASQDPSSDIFCGTGPLSEPETSSTAKYIRALPVPNRVAGMDVHSYGQKVLRNYGYSMKDTKDERKIKPIGDAMALEASNIHQSKYRSEKSAALYPTGGGMDDFFYMIAGMYGFTIELRDDGKYGFLLPPKFIRPTGDELAEMAKQLLLGLHQP